MNSAIQQDDPSTHGGLKRQQSLLFPSLLTKLDRSERLCVLDIGPAHNETIQFFSAYKCRLHFAGLYSESLTRNGSEGRDREDMAREFKRLLSVPSATRFDLVLFCDYTNYLDDEALCAFSDALIPYLHARTLGHGFAVRSSSTRIDNRWYGIESEHMFTVRPPRDRQPIFTPHAQAILINLLTCFTIDRGMLLPDGRLEVSMKAQLDSD